MAHDGDSAAKTSIVGLAMTCRDEILIGARQLAARSGRPEFTVPEIIAEMRASGTRYPDSTIRTHVVSRMCVGVPKHHAVVHRDLIRVDRGSYRLLSDAIDLDSTAEPRAAKSSKAKARTADIAERIERLVADFPRYVEAFDARPAFARAEQLRLHMETIALRRAVGRAGAALDDDRFLALLRQTLRAWGIGVRGSRLVGPIDFATALRSQSTAIERLDGKAIDDPSLDVPATARAVGDLISALQIVDNKAPLVAGSKALHHVLPELVVPIDREYTRRFFGWWGTQFQYKQQEFPTASACGCHPVTT